MNKEKKISSVSELLEIVNTGKSVFKVKLMPGISYTKKILKLSDGKYLITSFSTGVIVTRQEIDSKTNIPNQIKKGRLWIA